MIDQLASAAEGRDDLRIRIALSAAVSSHAVLSDDLAGAPR
jgi:hypothetical protein